jgi:hypothetical protein
VTRRQRLAALASAAAAFLAAPVAAADGTISDVVQNTGAREMPFWAYLYDNGFGYMQTSVASGQGEIVCANRAAGVRTARSWGCSKIAA